MYCNLDLDKPFIVDIIENKGINMPASEDTSSRFEVLEEETHYPVSRASSTDTENLSVEESNVEETLEEKLEKLMLDDGINSVKNASAAKEMGNTCVKMMMI